MKVKIIGLCTISLLFIGLSGCTLHNNGKEENIEFETKKDDLTVESSTSKDDTDSKINKLKEEAESEISVVKEQTKGLYSDITVSIEGDNTLVYTYIYENREEIKIDSESLKPELEKQIAPMMKSFKLLIPDFRIKFVYLNSNKTEAGSILITQDDLDAITAGSGKI